MIDDDDDLNAQRLSRDRALLDEERRRGRLRVTLAWSVVAVFLATLAVLAILAGDSKVLGLIVWALAAVFTPCALLFAFSTHARFRREVPSRRALWLVSVAMVTLLAFGLVQAWDVVRRFL